MYKGTREIQTCKITYYRQIKPLHNWPLPLLVSGLTAQLFHLKCSAEDTELRTSLRPQTHRLQTELNSKALTEVRYSSLSTQLISSALSRAPTEKSDAEKLPRYLTELKAGL